MSTTDGTVRAQQTRPVEPAEEFKQQPPPRTTSVFFPLGYKDAAYQWVSTAVAAAKRKYNLLTIDHSGRVLRLRQSSEAFSTSFPT